MPTSPSTLVAPPDASAALHRRRWWVLAVLCVSVLLVSVDNTIVNVALPSIGRALNASTGDLQWVVDGYTLAFAGLLLVGGHLGDRLGRRKVLQAGLVLFALTSLAASFATTTTALIAGRAAMGASAALIYPATLALLSTTFADRRERAGAIGIWSAVTGLAVAIGPVSGGVLLEHFAWNSVLWVSVPLAALALLVGWRLLPESRERPAGGFDIGGAALSITAIGLLVFTTIEAPNRGWASAATLVGFGLAGVALAAFVAWELRRRHPLIDVRLFANPRFSAASGAVALAFFGLFGFIFLITQYFQIVRGYSTLDAGLATLPFAVVVGALSPVAIVLMRRIGTKLVVSAGLLTMASGFVIAAGSAVDSPYWGRIVLAMVLMAGGLALVSGPATEAIMGALPAEQVGAGSAVNDTVREVGGTLGVAVVGSVMSTLYGPRVLDAWTSLGIPAPAADAATSSVIAGMQLAGGMTGPVQGPAVEAVREAFMDGLSAGSVVAALTCALGAGAALIWLPARHRDAADPAQSATPVTVS